MKYRQYLKIRIFLFISMLIIVPLGFFSKIYSGIADLWVHNSLGGVFYVLFWCLFVYFLFPGISFIKISIYVFIITSSIEFTQLIKTPLLNQIRSTFIGQSLIGTTFNSADFIYYFTGAFIAVIWIKLLRHASR
ncbi:MAG: DUF2809 domain-containing protein [Bacteroidales bacterium]|nr:DUF2809 domain-containing protein [Bacteroidales bacterium]